MHLSKKQVSLTTSLKQRCHFIQETLYIFHIVLKSIFATCISSVTHPHFVPFALPQVLLFQPEEAIQRRSLQYIYFGTIQNLE
jgi:hypothetical protein